MSCQGPFRRNLTQPINRLSSGQKDKVKNDHLLHNEMPFLDGIEQVEGSWISLHSFFRDRGRSHCRGRLALRLGTCQALVRHKAGFVTQIPGSNCTKEPEIRMVGYLGLFFPYKEVLALLTSWLGAGIKQPSLVNVSINNQWHPQAYLIFSLFFDRTHFRLVSTLTPDKRCVISGSKRFAWKFAYLGNAQYEPLAQQGYLYPHATDSFMICFGNLVNLELNLPEH